MTRYDVGSGAPASDDTRVPLILGIQTPLLIIALLVYIARIYSRCRPVLQLGWDDHFISLAMLCSVVSYGITIGLIELGYGQHIQHADVSKISLYARLNFVMQPLWVWGMTCIKLSIACLLVRLQRSIAWKVAMFASMVYLVGSAIAVTTLQFTECKPLRFYWDRKVEGGVCRSPHVVQVSIISTSIIFAISDVFFSLTPLLFIFTLSRPMKEKLLLTFLMGLGILASTIGALKFIGIHKLFTTHDPTWDNVAVKMGSFVEACLGIMAACIPCLRAMSEKTIKKLGASIGTSTGSGTTWSGSGGTGKDWTHKGIVREDTVYGSEILMVPDNFRHVSANTNKVEIERYEMAEV